MRDSTRLPLLAACILIVTAGCIGPTAGHRDGYVDQGPPPLTGPLERTTTHLRGYVIDARTNTAIAGASVTIAEKTAISGSDGAFTISNLLVAMGTLETVKAGYDTARTQLALNGGEVAFSPRLQPSTTPAP